MSVKRQFRRWFQQVGWLLPGLSIKRWIGVLIAGGLFLFVGVAILLNLHPIHWTIAHLRSIAPMIPTWVSGPAFVVAGIGLLIYGFRQTTVTVFEALGGGNGGGHNILEALYRKSVLAHGPQIVVIGGGTGLSTLLLGIKRYTSNITAVVTVADDGGSSGRLRQEFGIIPPGDIRNCIAALADEEQLITELFQYRFKSGHGLEGHSFGNLFLSVLCSITGNMVQAVKESSKVLNIRGRVLPATLESLCLVAELEGGEEVRGESQIPEAQAKILKLRCEPDNPEPLEEVIEAIEEAELIILGPGSLYTSVIPNLLIPKVAQAVHESLAPKVYICNVMTQPGETDDFTAADHVQVLRDHCPGKSLVDAIVVNNWIPETLVEKYRESGAIPVEIDVDRLDEMGLTLIERVLVDDADDFVRHDPKRLSKCIIKWFKREARPRTRGDNGDHGGGDGSGSESAIEKKLIQI